MFLGMLNCPKLRLPCKIGWMDGQMLVKRSNRRLFLLLFGQMLYILQLAGWLVGLKRGQHGLVKFNYNGSSFFTYIHITAKYCFSYSKFMKPAMAPTFIPVAIIINFFGWVQARHFICQSLDRQKLPRLPPETENDGNIIH